MKKIIELKNERSKLINDMENILKNSELEKRSKTEDENTSWNEKNERVKMIDKEVEILERQEELNRSIVNKSPLYTEEEKVSKRYNLAKAIEETRRGNLTGLEAEMHQEAQRELRGASGVAGNLFIPSMLLKRTDLDKTSGDTAGHLPIDVASLDVVVPTPLYRELGVTVYENLSAGKLYLPFSDGFNAGSLDEAATGTTTAPNFDKGELTATRYQGSQLYTNEYLAESAVAPQLLSDMISAIDRAIGKALVTEAAGVNVSTTYSGATGTTLTYEIILQLIAELNNENFTREGIVASKELFYYLAANPKVASTANLIIDLLGKGKGTMSGIDAYGTSFLGTGSADGNYQFVYGDWSRSYVGFWGGVQLLIDPYTSSDSGHTKITYSRMADVAANPYAFVSGKNFKIT